MAEIIAIAFAAWWLIFLAGHVAFNLGDSGNPGDGRGQVTTVEGVND